MPAQLIRVSEGAINEVGRALTSVLIGAVDEEGRQVVIETIDPAHLRATVLAALQSIALRPVLPSTVVIEINAERNYPWLKRTYPR